MWQEKQAELLTKEQEVILSSLADEVNLYKLAKQALARARRKFYINNPHNKPWPLLPLLVCHAISGCYEHAIPAAASLEFFKAAAEVFDDIEDADTAKSIPAKYSYATAVNVATTLLILAEKAIAHLEKYGVADRIIVHSLGVINSLCISACVGQHLDLTLTPGISVLEEEYLKIAAKKSASQVECACHIGALLATDDSNIIDTCVVFGYNLGMASQIANDIQGIIDGNDIQKRKITLPAIYALSQIKDKVSHHQLRSYFYKNSKSALNLMQVKDIFFKSGAIHYTTVKMEMYKQLARDILSKAEKSGINIEQLKRFVE
jgi:geranylgeranyl pyrophosphate synthase